MASGFQLPRALLLGVDGLLLDVDDLPPALLRLLLAGLLVAGLMLVLDLAALLRLTLARFVCPLMLGTVASLVEQPQSLMANEGIGEAPPKAPTPVALPQ